MINPAIAPRRLLPCWESGIGEQPRYLDDVHDSYQVRPAESRPSSHAPRELVASLRKVSTAEPGCCKA